MIAKINSDINDDAKQMVNDYFRQNPCRPGGNVYIYSDHNRDEVGPIMEISLKSLISDENRCRKYGIDGTPATEEENGKRQEYLNGLESNHHWVFPKEIATASLTDTEKLNAAGSEYVKFLRDGEFMAI